MTNTNTTPETTRQRSEHLSEIEMEMHRLYNIGKIEESERDPTLYHAEAMEARIERLQTLWLTWSHAIGYATDSARYRAFVDALKACQENGDLLPDPETRAGGEVTL